MKLLLLVFVVLAVGAHPAGAAVYFDLQRVSNRNSTLLETRQDPSTGKVYAQQAWRAGSGYLTNECTKSAGWLPGGYYNLVSHYDNYDGSVIKGRVWQLSDKVCWNGTPRRELFIHSEETASNGQYCTSASDDPYCWEGDFDYESAGCIKLSRATPYPSHLAQADADWHNWGGGSGHLNLYQRVFVY